MGENDFRHLQSEVKGLKDTVNEQQQDLQVISVCFLASCFQSA